MCNINFSLGKLNSLAISSFEKSDTVMIPSQLEIILGSSSLNIFKYLSLTVSGNFKGLYHAR